MAEAENKLKREGADEESMVIEASVTGAPQVTASASIVVPDVQKEAAGGSADAEPSASMLVKVTEQVPIAMVTKEAVEDVKGVTDEGKNDTIATNEDGKNKSTVKRGKGTTPSRSVKRRQDRKKRKAAGNDGGADPSESALVKVENASAVMTGSNEGKAGEEGDDNDGKEVSDNDNDGKVEMPNTAESLVVATMAAGGTAKDNDGREVSDKEKVDSTLRKKNKKRKKSNKTQVTAEEAAGNAEVGAVKKLSDTKRPAGMIFMCSSKTKKECYRYKIFGMPAGRKEMVAKVYKGMKLFLYDIDLKLLYGTYVAASKGGYDIRPKAFNSAFPSQVRFKVLKEYSPLSQEKIKAAIKSNYYKKNMFNCELSSEQVHKLTKLFVEATKAAKPSDSRAARKRVSESISRETKGRQYMGTGDHVLPRRHDRYERDAYVSQQPVQAPFPPQGSAMSRHARLPLYSSPPRVSALPPPPPSYAYERPGDMDVDYYRRELEARGYKVVDPDWPLLDRVAYDDPYSMYREPASYLETRPTSTLPSGYHASAFPPYRY